MTVLLASIVVDVTAVVALSLIAATALRRHSATMRHMVLAVAIVAAAAAPLLEIALPQVPVVRWQEAQSAISSGMTWTSEGVTAPSVELGGGGLQAPAISWVAILMGVWLCGALASSIGLFIGFVRLARIKSRCTRVHAGRWRELTDDLCRDDGLRRRVSILQSHDRTLLVTFGMLRPVIVLPAGASAWSDACVRSVLAHELAHIRRFDGVLHLVAETVRIIHWFNPLVWLACRQMRLESEHACDDAVLSGGIDAADYASHLLGVARHAVGPHHAWAAVPAIAHPSTLERRIAAVLRDQRNRTRLTSRGWVVAVLMAAAVIGPLAAASVAPARDVEGAIVLNAGAVTLQPRPGPADEMPARPAVRPKAAVRAPALAAVQTPGAIAGTFVDQSGGRLPGVRVTLTDVTSGAQGITTTDPNGQFVFRDLQPSRYELVASLPGFAPVGNVLTLESGASLTRTMTMPVGSVQETITVLCFGTALAAPPRPERVARLRAQALSVERILDRALQAFAPVVAAQERRPPVRIGGQIRGPAKITDVKPACPGTPASDTSVRLIARIAVDGYLSDLRPFSSGPDGGPAAEFTDSALEAVRQWKYTPTLLNGEPVEVTVTIAVLYKEG